MSKHNNPEITYDKWDIRFIELAEFISSWSKDPSTKVGAVVVDKNNRIVGTGYNGYPQHIPDDDLHNRENKIAKVLHAEENALAFSYRDVTGFTLYCTHCPCSHCASMIVQRGIKRVVYCEGAKDFQNRWKEANKMALNIFKMANISVLEMSNDKK